MTDGIASSSLSELLQTVVDPGSFLSWDAPLDPPAGASSDYKAALARARQRTGLDEAAATGRGTVDGVDAAFIAIEFGFMGGSIGVRTSERIHAAVRRATAQRLPLVALPASGGTRMQEGAAAFIQMIRTTAAIETHKAAGLPYLVYLRNPTAGGVFASWGSLGQLTAAEPGAMLGFLGPKVHAALVDEDFPPGVQTAENLLHHGILDSIVAPEELRDWLSAVLGMLTSRPAVRKSHDASPVAAPVLSSRRRISTDPWACVLRSRNPGRPRSLNVVHQATDSMVFLHGNQQGTTERGLFAALATVSKTTCVFIGLQDTGGNRPMLGPACLQLARRAMALAEQLGLPFVSLIDTAGAELSVNAEEGAMAGEIARTLAKLIRLETYTVSVLLGRGTGGGALALLPADTVIAADSGWLAPLPPEGAASILYSDTSMAPLMAREQQITAAALYSLGVVDRIVPEFEGDSGDEFCLRMAHAIATQIDAAPRPLPPDILASRESRLERLGSVHSSHDHHPTPAVTPENQR